jgi:hypothetical protein
MREGCVMRTVKTVSLIIVSLMTLGLMTAPAWAQAHYASGYTVLRTGGCTISSAGNICAHGPFAMPAAARLADYTVLWFILNCTSSADFDIDVRVNTAVVRSFDSLSGVRRGEWEVLLGGTLAAAGNIVEFVASGEDSGSCTISDVILQYRLNTVP